MIRTPSTLRVVFNTPSTSTIVNKKRKKCMSNIFFRKLHLCQISSKSLIDTSVCTFLCKRINHLLAIKKAIVLNFSIAFLPFQLYYNYPLHTHTCCNHSTILHHSRFHSAGELCPANSLRDWRSSATRVSGNRHPSSRESIDSARGILRFGNF